MKESLKKILIRLAEGQKIFYIHPPELNRPMKVEITEVLIEREWKPVQVKCIDDGFQQSIQVEDDSPTFGYDSEHITSFKTIQVDAKGKYERYDSDYFILDNKE